MQLGLLTPPAAPHGGRVLLGSLARNQRIQTFKNRDWKPKSPSHFLSFGNPAGKVELAHYLGLQFFHSPTIHKVLLNKPMYGLRSGK